MSSFARRWIDVPKRLKNQNNQLCRWRGFVFLRDQEIVVIVVLGLKFSLSLTRLPNFSAIYTLRSDPWASRKAVFWSVTQECKMCFLSIPTLIPHRMKKRNACSLLNTSYNIVTKQYIFVLRIKAFLIFLAKTQVTDSSQMKTKQKKPHNETRRHIW